MNEYPIKLEFVQKNECLLIHSNCKITLFEIEIDCENEYKWNKLKTIDLSEKFGNFYVYSYSVKFIKEIQAYRFITISLMKSKSLNKLRVFDLHFNKDDTEELNLIAEYECVGVPLLASLVGDNLSNCCFLSNKLINDIKETTNNKEETINDIIERISKDEMYEWKQKDEKVTIMIDIPKKELNNIKIDFTLDEIEFIYINDMNEKKIKVKLMNRIVVESCQYIIFEDLR